MNAAGAISIRNLALRYGDRAVLDDVTLELSAGALIGLVGPNGAGKTTLLRTIAGLVAPDSGSVRFDRNPLPAKAIASSGLVSYLPQHHEAHWPVSVETLVSLGLLARRAFHMSEAERQIKVEQALDDLDLQALRDRTVDTLSGGERARTHLARAVAQDAPVLLADEPAADLDPHHACVVMEYLQRLSGRQTVVVVLHDLVLAQRYCHRVIMLANGRIVADDAPQAALSAAIIHRVYGIRTIQADTGDGSVVIPWDIGPPD